MMAGDGQGRPHDSGTSRTMDQVLPGAAMLFALGLPVSIAIGQAAAYLVVALALWGWATRRLSLTVPRGIGIPAGLFLVCLAVASAVGWDPRQALWRMDRFLLLVLMAALPAVMSVSPVSRLRWGPFLINAFVAGCALQAAADLVRIPMEVNAGVPLYDTGNMRDPQLYMTALCLLAPALSTGRWRIREPFAATALLVISLAFLLHFKRGTWISLCLALVWMCCLLRTRTPLLVFAGLAAASLGLPAVRTRLAMLSNEVTTDLGGRYVLWTEAAPVLLADHPLGVGWRVMRHEHLAAAVQTLQPGLDHLHNNLLQLAVEAGWLGLAAWVVWMGGTLLMATRQALRLRAGNPAAASLAIGVSGALVALLANGMVEFNFGDSEIFMTYLFLIGLALYARRLPATGRWESPPPPPPPRIL